jgi:ribosomal protein S18 acetylase RimI-like enzyme
VQSEELDEEPMEDTSILDLIILSAYRCQGLGRTLLRTAEEYARQHGAPALKLKVLAKNDGVLSLYQWVFRLLPPPEKNLDS